MGFFTQWLIRCAEALLAAWEWIVEHGGDVLSAINHLLNPILSPVLAFLNPICTTIADLVYAVLRPLPTSVGLAVLSIALGVVMLFAFRGLSNQTKIGRAKDDIKANLLALKLFKDDLRVMFSSQVRIAWAILRLQRYVLTPVLWATPPMLLILAQMGVRYQWRPLLPGETTILRVTLEEPRARARTVTLDASAGIAAEVGPLAGDRDFVWRIRAAQPGRHTLRIKIDGQELEKELVVGAAGQRVSALRPADRWIDQLFHPNESRLPIASGVQSIEIEYPSPTSWISGADYLVLTFFVISMLAALILAPVFRVRF